MKRDMQIGEAVTGLVGVAGEGGGVHSGLGQEGQRTGEKPSGQATEREEI